MEDGHAFTFGWTWEMREHVELAAEWLQIDSDYTARVVLGQPTKASEHSLQLALRLIL